MLELALVLLLASGPKAPKTEVEVRASPIGFSVQVVNPTLFIEIKNPTAENYCPQVTVEILENPSERFSPAVYKSGPSGGDCVPWEDLILETGEVPKSIMIRWNDPKLGVLGVTFRVTVEQGTWKQVRFPKILGPGNSF